MIYTEIGMLRREFPPFFTGILLISFLSLATEQDVGTVGDDSILHFERDMSLGGQGWNAMSWMWIVP